MKIRMFDLNFEHITHVHSGFSDIVQDFKRETAKIVELAKLASPTNLGNTNDSKCSLVFASSGKSFKKLHLFNLISSRILR